MIRKIIKYVVLAMRGLLKVVLYMNINTEKHEKKDFISNCNNGICAWEL